MEIYAVISACSRNGAPEVDVNYMGTDLDEALQVFKAKFKGLAWDERKGCFEKSNGFMDFVQDVDGDEDELSTQFNHVFDELVDKFVSSTKNSKVTVDQEWCNDYDEPFMYMLVRRVE